MAPDFIRGWTSLVEGEKDPRNLTLIFAINRVVLVEFDIRSHVEVMCLNSTLDGDPSLLATHRIFMTSSFATFQSPSNPLRTTLTEYHQTTSVKLCGKDTLIKGVCTHCFQVKLRGYASFRTPRRPSFFGEALRSRCCS